jgi:hypothetical protein
MRQARLPLGPLGVPTLGPLFVTFVTAFLQRRIKIVIADVPEMSVRGRSKAAGS